LSLWQMFLAASQLVPCRPMISVTAVIHEAWFWCSPMYTDPTGSKCLDPAWKLNYLLEPSYELDVLWPLVFSDNCWFLTMCVQNWQTKAALWHSTFQLVQFLQDRRVLNFVATSMVTRCGIKEQRLTPDGLKPRKVLAKAIWSPVYM
jgi:hypothetical protein